MHGPGLSNAPTPPSPAAAMSVGRPGRDQRGCRVLRALLPLLVALGLPHSALAAPEQSTVLHSGPCNASTALSMGRGLFVVGDNREKPPVTLRLYRSGQEGPPVGAGLIAARAVAPVNDGHPELDLEASARIGPLAYWIGSHGAAAGNGKAGKGDGKLGEPRPNRQRLFATTLGVRAVDDGKTITLTLEPVGQPYTTLIEELSADPRYARFNLEAASRRPAKAKGGLSIEGLAATPSGALLIGFRNPLPEGKALLVPLTNPNAVLSGEKAVFGDPVLLDLGGLGVRSLERVNGNLLIVAGPAEGSKGKSSGSALYRWSGQFESPAVRLRRFDAVSGGAFNPEALLVDGDSLVVLSDDGKLERDGQACQDLPLAKQGFRELRITPIP